MLTVSTFKYNVVCPGYRRVMGVLSDDASTPWVDCATPFSAFPVMPCAVGVR